MADIGVYEAKTHLPRLLDEVEAGANITITRNGRAVARLSPVAGTAGAVARLLELRAGVRKGRLSMRGLIVRDRR